MTIDQLYKIYRQYPSVQTDTRKLKTGDLFFALKGPNFNGNQFAAAALEAGSAYAIVDDPGLAGTTPNDRIIVVDDVLTTLQQLAAMEKPPPQNWCMPFFRPVIKHTPLRAT